jgi:hypothetical protein
MIQLTLDTQALIAELDDIRRNQVPFAMSLAMNRTMEEVQVAQLRHIADEMTIRNRLFITRLVKIAPEDRATKDRLSAGIRIEGPRSKPDRGKVLTRHEVGGIRSTASQAPMFVPSRFLRGAPSQVISQRLYPSYLGVVTSRVGDSGRFVEPTFTQQGPRGTRHVRGRRNTFVLTPDLGHRISSRAAGVYQRIGPGAGAIVRLWMYRPTTQLTPSLEFSATFNKVVAERYNENFTGALAYALDENRQASASKAWKAARASGWRPPRLTEIL